MKIGEDNSVLKLLDSKLARVLEIIAEQSYKDGLWVSSDESKQYVCGTLNISSPTYFRYVKTLVNKNVLIIQPGKGVYRLNSKLLTT